MRFFSGSREGSGGKKQTPAGAFFQKKLRSDAPKMADSLDKRIKNEINSSLDNYAKQRKQIAERRGEKNVKVPEISKNARKMVAILATKKVLQEVKQEKKAAAATKAAERREEQAKMLAKQQAKSQNEQGGDQSLAAQEASASVAATEAAAAAQESSYAASTSDRWNYFSSEE